MRAHVERFKVPIDDDLQRDLGLAGHKLGDVLGKDESVCVRSAANVAIGGIHTEDFTTQGDAVRVVAALGEGGQGRR